MAVGSFGERMQRERELRGVTLDEISVVTKIGTRSLKALEEEDFEKLPGGIFNKGFVRAYARYLGIDPDEAVADYLTAVEVRNRPPAFELPQDPTAGADSSLEVVPEFASVEEPGSSYGSLVLAAVVAVLAIAVGAWWVLSGNGPSVKRLLGREGKVDTPSATSKEAPPQPNEPAPPRVAQGESSSAPSFPTSTSSESSQPTGRAPVLAAVSPSLLSPAAKAADERAAAAKAAANKAVTEDAAAVSTTVTTVPVGTGFTVHLRAEEDSWVTVTADGKQITKGLLAAVDERSIRAGKQIIVRLGNAGGVQVAFNGKDLPNIGEKGEVRILAFGPNGREAYTPPAPAPAMTAPQPAANAPNPQ
jgi:cytoskeleton protein RodZ